MAANLHPEVVAQIEALALTPGRPLVLCDADEVLVAFMADFELWLAGRDLEFAWGTFALTGNVRTRADRRALDQIEVHALLENYFAERAEHVPPVAGAAETLAELSSIAQIVVLSNVPPAHRHKRIAGLKRHGIAYPVIANVGSKGPVVAQLAARVGAPTAFIDDSPRHHAAVAAVAEQVLRIYYIADPRLAAIAPAAGPGTHRAQDWPEIGTVIRRAFAG
ncbi:MAG: hypothetical protein FJX46_15290 [Alphaproteobacteria bacterium]|nr:hypothetical protein [Alphaproteobacteria bacterium]